VWTDRHAVFVSYGDTLQGSSAYGRCRPDWRRSVESVGTTVPRAPARADGRSGRPPPCLPI
jgi:hypothetical protein